jgi:hypothetical protein
VQTSCKRIEFKICIDSKQILTLGIQGVLISASNSHASPDNHSPPKEVIKTEELLKAIAS